MRRKRLTQEEFDKVKLLQQAAVGNSSAMRITGRSASTISRIYRAENYDEYTSALAETHPYVPAGGETKIVSSEDLPVFVKDIKSIPQDNLEALLERIAVAAERMADAWESQPKKKRLF